ncbi:hypothetical protein AB0K43_24035 [Kitasatospora sp. NPDC049258]|uniref:hypothetical protein n=1 Tax=Kitasatospora sp. NPDC049258 TaxID=3155394 RepID=UPI00342BB582
MMRIDGPWRITVVGKDADFEQRAVVRTAYGTHVLAGRVGEFLDVREDSWELILEHHYPGLSWRPDFRVVPGPVSSHGGRLSRVVQAKDVLWPQHPHDTSVRNFVIRLEALGAEAPRRSPQAAPVPSATRTARTSSAPDLALMPTPDSRSTPRTATGPAEHLGEARRSSTTGSWSQHSAAG